MHQIIRFLSFRYFFLIALSVFLSHLTRAQNPRLLTTRGSELPVMVESVVIDVEIAGNVATTTTTLIFYNPNNRILEGELNFPLADGQEVFRYALDVNGQLREGVVVEKTLGRQAFEDVVRQNIDPGLLEKTVGNNYKTRIYPIPARGRKKVVIGIEETLPGGATPRYLLDTNFGYLADFELNINVLHTGFSPRIEQNELGNFSFVQRNSGYNTNVFRENANIFGKLSFVMVGPSEAKVYRQSAESGDYFFATIYPEVKKVEKALPKSLSIAWDVSQSGLRRNLEKELNLLTQYLKYCKNVNVEVLLFGNAIHERRQFSVWDGAVGDVIDYLQSAGYDGGTDLNALFNSIFTGEELLLFSDGISNLSKTGLLSSVVPVYSIHSQGIGDTRTLRSIATTSGGQYINLNRDSVEKALLQLQSLPYQLIRVTADDPNVSELFPNTATNLSEGTALEIAGKVIPGQNSTLTLTYGIAGKVMQIQQLTIGSDLSAFPVARRWARAKVRQLSMGGPRYKNEIISLAKAHQLVTDYTSLIVLDRLEDYLRYGIPPPPELQEEYERVKELIGLSPYVTKFALADAVIAAYKERIKWWDREFGSISRRKAAKRNRVIRRTEPIGNFADGLTLNPSQQDSNHAAATQLLAGQVFDKTGKPITGANVMVKGKEVATKTDANGKFLLSVNSYDVLLFKFAGLGDQEVAVEGSSILEITMTSQVTRLRETPSRSAQRSGRSTRNNQPDESKEDPDMANFRRQYERRHVTDASQRSGSVQRSAVSSGTGAALRMAGPNEEPPSQDKPSASGKLYLLDGNTLSSNALKQITPASLHQINTIAPNNEVAVSLLGNGAKDGVVLLTSKARSSYRYDPLLVSTFEPKVRFKSWTADEPYIPAIKALPANEQYDYYLRARSLYGTTPGFYLAIADHFIVNNQLQTGLRVLSNVAELKLEDHELLKVMANKYRQLKMWESSLYFHEKLVTLRPEEPHSKRDYALTLQEAGMYQEALDLLLELLFLEAWKYGARFPLMKQTMLFELNNLIALHKDQLDLSNVPEEWVKPLPVDVRVVIDWNSLETDLDLWIEEPSGEECGYSNKKTAIGGRFTADYRDGYGPEEYILKKAIPGRYFIKVDYFDHRMQKVSGPVTIQVSVYTHYGSSRQQVTRHMVQLKKTKELKIVGSFIWE